MFLKYRIGYTRQIHSTPLEQVQGEKRIKEILILLHVYYVPVQVREERCRRGGREGVEKGRKKGEGRGECVREVQYKYLLLQINFFSRDGELVIFSVI